MRSSGKILCTIIGAVLGLAASYLFRPYHPLLAAPTITEWFTEGIKMPQYAPVIIISGIIGAVIGLVVGVFLDKSPNNRLD
jgi:uncharacterized membrane protein YeaQ/YmgE (transglycosylase-associated protein family)